MVKRRLVVLAILLGASAASAALSAWKPPREGAASPGKPCETLKARLCDRYGATSRECHLARVETKSFADARCVTMLGRFDAVASELGQSGKASAELGSRDQHLVHGDAPFLGAPDAPVLVVEFSDFDCDDCARMSLMANAVRNRYGDRVRLVFRQFPRHPEARLAAEASLAAHAQGRFWEYHDVLFGNPQDHGRAALERYAAEVGLDVPAFRRALDEHRYAPDVDADIARGRDSFVTDLPAVFANGKRVSAPYGERDLETLLASAPQPNE